MKTSELQGAALDWAVAKCESWVIGTTDDDLVSYVLENSADEMHFWPSTDWAQGGPIIEREGITLRNFIQGDAWDAELDYEETFLQSGPTPLIAAMRCYVASKLGDEIEVPEELWEQA